MNISRFKRKTSSTLAQQLSQQANGEIGRMELAIGVRESGEFRIANMLFRIFLILVVFSSLSADIRTTNGDEEYEKFLTKLKEMGSERRDSNY